MHDARKAYLCPVCGGIMTPGRPPRKGDFKIPYYCNNEDCPAEKLYIWISKTDLKSTPDGCYQEGWKKDEVST